jgi:hypothetical protein
MKCLPWIKDKEKKKTKKLPALPNVRGVSKSSKYAALFWEWATQNSGFVLERRRCSKIRAKVFSFADVKAV